ncbi:MAG: type IV secretion system DNA-binding domain-containing protein [Bacteroidota bacterium]
MHCYIVGKSGSGKTTLLETLISQDIQNRRGCALIDPHGDLVERIYESLPINLKEDVIYLNIPDLNQPWGYNPFRKIAKEKRPLLASGILNVFEHVWDKSWGARLEHILRYCLLTLLDQPQASMKDIASLLTDKSFRAKCLNHIEREEVTKFWTKEFGRYKNDALVPILNKVGAFLAYPCVRRLLEINSQNISLRSIMDEQKILLVNLSKGIIGEDASTLIGSLLITSLGLGAFSRADTLEEKRLPFFIYVDEFQNFTGTAMMSMLSELRKYKVGLILAHQYLDQLDEGIKSAILGNVGTLISFRLGPKDAPLIAKEFDPIFEPIDLINLPNYNILLKLMIEGIPSKPFSASTIQVKDIQSKGVP